MKIYVVETEEQCEEAIRIAKARRPDLPWSHYLDSYNNKDGDTLAFALKENDFEWCHLEWYMCNSPWRDMEVVDLREGIFPESTFWRNANIHANGNGVTL